MQPVSKIMRNGFTLLEILVTLTVIAVVATTVVPMFSDDSRLRVMAASGVLCSDIELAEVMTISHPDKPVVVRFNTDRMNEYWLAYASDPTTPLPRADTGVPYRVIFGQDRASGAQGVLISLDGVKDGSLSFDAQGGLADFTSAPKVTLHSGSQSIILSIAAHTGTISESQAK